MASTTTLEAERADRISRLAGLERVATARAGGQQLGGAQWNNPAILAAHIPGYFDNQPSIKERSTVGSASATGSVGGRTTWASGSDGLELDKMSEDPDDGVSSVGNISDDEGDADADASLVGFGEGAGSTISGSTSHPGLSRMSSGSRPSSLGSPIMNRANPVILSYMQRTSDSPVLPASPSPAGSNTPEAFHDGVTYDPDVVGRTARTPRLAGGLETSKWRTKSERGDQDAGV